MIQVVRHGELAKAIKRHCEEKTPFFIGVSIIIKQALWASPSFLKGIDFSEYKKQKIKVKYKRK